MDLLVALETIRNASDAILHCHAAQTILTLRSVSQRLQCRLSPDFHATPWNQPSPPSPPQSPHLLEVAETPALRGRPSVSSQSLLQVQAEVRDQIAVLSSPSQSTQVSVSHVSAQSPSTPTTQLIPTRETSPLQSTHVSVSHVSAQSPSTPTTQLILTRETPLGVIPPKPIRPQPDKITDLLGRIKKSAQWVFEISQPPFSQVLSCKRDIREDLRLEHVRRLEGDPNLDHNAKLLRILAIRSMALEFTNEEVAAEVFPTKLEEVYRHALSQSPSKPRVFNYNTEEISTKAKSAGLKHLVFEKVIAHRLKECGLPDMCDAVSAMCGLHIEKFRRFPYNQMLGFANMILSQETQVMISDSKINLLDLIRYLSPWFQQLQVHYDLIYCRPPVSVIDSGRHKFPQPNRTYHPDNVVGPRSSDGSRLDSNELQFEDFEILQDLDCFQDTGDLENFNPLQDMDVDLENFNPLQDMDVDLENFNPLQDMDADLENFNPLQDMDADLENFNPLQDMDADIENFNPLQDIEGFQNLNHFLFPSVHSDPDADETLPDHTQSTPMVSIPS